jgi:lipoprotein-releasing system ATP-binding protein
MPSELRLQNVYKSYGTPDRRVEVLRGISFELVRGEALVVMGPSGSGKSTLLHLIGTLDFPTSGAIEIEGKNPMSFQEPELAKFRNQVIGFVFQDHHLLPQYSVLENVLIPSFVRKDTSENPEKRAKELLQRVGLSHRLDHKPSELSGGERQRVAVARALLNRPRLLLCDEPTGNLDRTNAHSVANLLFDLHGEEKNIMIVVTHSHEIADKFHHRFELNEGKIVSK